MQQQKQGDRDLQTSVRAAVAHEDDGAQNQASQQLDLAAGLACMVSLVWGLAHVAMPACGA